MKAGTRRRHSLMRSQTPVFLSVSLDWTGHLINSTHISVEIRFRSENYLKLNKYEAKGRCRHTWETVMSIVCGGSSCTLLCWMGCDCGRTCAVSAFMNIRLNRTKYVRALKCHISSTRSVHCGTKFECTHLFVCCLSNNHEARVIPKQYRYWN